MVYRAMEPNVLPLPPPSMGRQGSRSSHRSTPSKGFRLLDDQAETGSVYSIYKQKIDAMFESDSSGQVSNTVQARIERMFTEVAEDEGVKSDVGCHSFSIDYLGSIPLVQKVTSLSGLQVPLKELYFAYKRNSRHKSTLTGRLEISHVGLKVQYQGDKGDLEQLNPFPTIAVWSAVKFVLHNEPKKSYAFLPLITDPDNIDKQSLFRNLEENESKYIVNQTHAPLFAVVMRKIGLHKQLECHGFVCQTSEDAIVIAATLYKSLMSHMKSKDKKPRNRNGVSCMSVSSSICADSIQNATPVRPPRKKRSTASSIISETETTKDVDTNKQVRKSTKTRRAPTIPSKTNQGNMDEILPYEEPNGEPKNGTQKEWKDQSGQGEESELKRSRSFRKLNEEGIMTKNGENSGDILTKVTIPRSGSFLNAGGLTRYKSKVNRYNGQVSGGSPLGFNELFNEFRLQEGLHSMDEILGVIIDSEGMSFNDLKPIYKEFLLKLAVTLTKDELYQRSKAIMRRQKKKILRKNSNAQKNRRNIIVGAKGLKRVFRKSFRLNFSKRIYKKKQKNKVFELKKTPVSEKKQAAESSISTSSYDTRQFRPKQSNVVRKQSYRKRNSDIKEANMRIRRERMSTSEDSDFFTMKRSKSKTSPNNQNRNSSSGYGLGCPPRHIHNLQHCKIDYVSCSECSYDSDTCTCVSADKCYCSLGNKFERNHNRNHAQHSQKASKPRPHTSLSCRTDERCYCTVDSKTFSWCGCDTDSCTDSNKCYCQNFTPKGTIFEQLQRRGFIPTSEDMITPPNERKLCKKNSNTRSTKSVEYVHNPTEMYYEKIGQKNSMSHEFLSARPGSRRSYSSDNLARECEVTSTNGKRINPLYSRAMSEVATRNFPLQNSVRSFKSFNENNRRLNGNTLQTTVPANSSTEALSVKKSAEIAALFTDIKLSQTTDITHLLPRDYSDLSGQNTNYCKQLHSVKPMPKTDKKAIVAPYKHVSNLKLSQNALYAARTQPNGKNGLYSARNGLYTIQSQSDSSCSENKNDKTYFNMKQDGGGALKKSVNNSLENTLGYLP